MVVLDPDLRVLFANQRFYRVFQTTCQETEGAKIYDLGNGQWNDPKLRTLLEQILPSKSSFEDFEVERDFPVIGHKIMRLNARQIKGPPPVTRPLVLVVLEDLTERVQLARDRDEALKSREELVAVVSHEIKNPLATITSSLDVLGKTMPPFEGRLDVDRQLFQMRAAAERMARITNDLLDITRIEMGRLPLKRAPVDIPALIGEIATLFQARAGQKSIQIEKHLSPEVQSLDLDRDRIAQVLMNLLDNAIRFTGTGGWVRISVQKSADQVRFGVSDSGPGIPEDQLPHVFERFWQAKHRQYMGTGLGLYIAKSIVTAHRGTIGAESTVGQGSTFYFLLPAEAASGNAAGRAA
jgi:two-component system CheB/CheR fusion protein